MARRAKSYSDFYDIVQEHLAKDGAKPRRRKRQDKAWEALSLQGPGDTVEVQDAPLIGALQDELLEASQEEYL